MYIVFIYIVIHTKTNKFKRSKWVFLGSTVPFFVGKEKCKKKNLVGNIRFQKGKCKKKNDHTVSVATVVVEGPLFYSQSQTVGNSAI